MSKSKYGDESLSVGLPPRERELVIALENRDLRKFKQCLADGANANVVLSNKTSVLFCAALGREPQFVKALLKAGADPNFRIGGHPTLMQLAFLGVAPEHAECVAALIESGADVAVRVEGATALDIAVSWKHTEMVKVLKAAKVPCSQATRVAMWRLLKASQSPKEGRET